MVYFTSDLHFGHENIIKLCNRPFDSVEEMDAILIEKWNKKVKGQDTVYIIGDFIWKGVDPNIYLSKLKGKKVLIVGNHDSNWLCKQGAKEYFQQITNMLEESICCHQMTLCHYPMLEWKGSRKIGSSKQSYLMHGHIHNQTNIEDYGVIFKNPCALNVGVDINNFEPVTFEEVVENNILFKEKVLKENNIF